LMTGVYGHVGIIQKLAPRLQDAWHDTEGLITRLITTLNTFPVRKRARARGD
jgi:hypothetical protein